MNIGSRPEINRNHLVGQSHVDSLLNPEGDIKEDFVAASIHLNMTHFRCRRNVPYSSELEILQLSHWSETEIYVKSVIARGTESEIHDDDTNVIFFFHFLFAASLHGGDATAAADGDDKGDDCGGNGDDDEDDADNNDGHNKDDDDDNTDNSSSSHTRAHRAVQ